MKTQIGEKLDCFRNHECAAGDRVTVYLPPESEDFRISPYHHPLDAYGLRHFVVAYGVVEDISENGSRCTVAVDGTPPPF